MAETEVRPLRLCDSCGGVDDHPRHVIWHAPGDGKTDPEVIAKATDNAQKYVKDNPRAVVEVVRQALDDTTIAKHMDCCRADGCPDGSCNVVTKGAEDLKGSDLVEHLVARGPLPPHQIIFRGEVLSIHDLVPQED